MKCWLALPCSGMLGVLTQEAREQSQSFKNTKTHVTGRAFEIFRFCKLFWGKRGSWASVGPTGRRLPDRRSCRMAPLRGFPLPAGSNRRRGTGKTVGFCSPRRPAQPCQKSRSSGSGKGAHSCRLLDLENFAHTYMRLRLTSAESIDVGDECAGVSVGMKREGPSVLQPVACTV